MTVGIYYKLQQSFGTVCFICNWFVLISTDKSAQIVFIPIYVDQLGFFPVSFNDKRVGISLAFPFDSCYFTILLHLCNVWPFLQNKPVVKSANKP